MSSNSPAPTDSTNAPALAVDAENAAQLPMLADRLERHAALQKSLAADAAVREGTPA